MRRLEEFVFSHKSDINQVARCITVVLHKINKFIQVNNPTKRSQKKLIHSWSSILTVYHFTPKQLFPKFTKHFCVESKSAFVPYLKSTLNYSFLFEISYNNSTHILVANFSNLLFVSFHTKSIYENTKTLWKSTTNRVDIERIENKHIFFFRLVNFCYKANSLLHYLLQIPSYIVVVLVCCCLIVEVTRE